MRFPRIWGTHSHYLTNVIGVGDDPDVPAENSITSIIKEFINNSGGNLVLGDVVKIDTSGDRLVIKTSTAADLNVLGVVAAAGPFANAAAVPVMLEGYHPSVKVTGAVSRGDYLFGSTTAGVATANAAVDEGAFGRVVSDDVAGFAAAVIFDKVAGAGGAATFLELTDTPANYTGSGGKLLAVNAGGTAVEFISTGAEVGQYDPRVKPASPSSTDDEFDDSSLAGVWTQQDGGTATHTVSETDRKGFLHITNIDGGAGSDTGVYKTFTPGAAVFTIAARVFATVRDAGSNQSNLQVLDSSGNMIYNVGMLNGSTFIVSDSGGFRSYNVTYISPNIGEAWLMIRRDASTNYEAYVSGDGHIWTRLEGANRSGTVGRAKIVNVSFGSSTGHGWWDFIRMFTSTTLDVGGVATGLGSSQYTDENAQDAVAAMVIDSSELDFTYVDATPSLTATIKANSVVAGRLTMATARLIGRTTAAAGAGEEISVGTGLALAAGVLSNTVTAPVGANPTQNVGLTVVNGVAATFMRSDGAPALNQSIVPTWTGNHVWGSGATKLQSGTKTITATLDSMYYIANTITNNTGTFINGLHIGPVFAGSGDSPVGLVVRPFMTPTANLTEAFGGSLAAFGNPPTGVTITTLYGFRGLLASSAGAGAITNAIAIAAQGNFTNIGGPTPTNNISLQIGAASGGTNNYDMSFTTVDLTAAGTYYGRVPVLYNGLKKYLHLFNA